MNPSGWYGLAAGWGILLGEVALKTSLLLSLLLLADHLLGQGRASWRNLVWLGGLAGLALIPLAAGWGPSLQLPLGAGRETLASARPPLAPAPEPLTRFPSPTPAEVPLALAPPLPLAVGDEGQPWPAWLLLVYLAGVAGCLARLGAGLRGVAALRRQARPLGDDSFALAFAALRAQLGIRRKVHLSLSAQANSPLQLGVLSPMVILPARLLPHLDAQTFRAVAAHELAHVRRWDYLFYLVAALVLALYWFNPLAWLALRRLRQTSEHTCDEWAVRLTGRYEVYARALLAVLDQLPARQPRFGLSMAHQAEERLERILAMRNMVPAGVGHGASVALLAGLATGAVLLGCSGLVSERRATSPPPSELASHSSILPAFTQKVTAAFPSDFMGIPWGSSMAVASTAMRRAGGREPVWDGEPPPDWLAFVEVPFGNGTSADVQLSFFSNQFCSATVSLHLSEDQAAAEFQSWRAILTHQYGPAYEFGFADPDSLRTVSEILHLWARGRAGNASWWFANGRKEADTIHLSLQGRGVSISYSEEELYSKTLAQRKLGKPTSYSYHYQPKPTR